MSYTRTISCRLSESDYDALLTRSAELGVKPSEYLRYLIRIPLGTKGFSNQEACIVFDRDSFSRILRELTKWGYHYNQAVRSMNTIALFIRRGRLELDHFASAVGLINEKLENIDNAKNDMHAQMIRLEQNIFIAGD